MWCPFSLGAGNPATSGGREITLAGETEFTVNRRPGFRSCSASTSWAIFPSHNPAAPVPSRQPALRACLRTSGVTSADSDQFARPFRSHLAQDSESAAQRLPSHPPPPPAVYVYGLSTRWKGRDVCSCLSSRRKTVISKVPVRSGFRARRALSRSQLSTASPLPPSNAGHQELEGYRHSEMWRVDGSIHASQELEDHRR